jgi:hypothetical protein
MRSVYAGFVVLVFAASLSAAERFNVRVLYCGDPESQRQADFHAFLAQHFTQVTLRDLREFMEADAEGQDVVIFDWSMGYDGKGGIDQAKRKRFRVPHVSMKFARPTILIAWAGGEVATWHRNPLKLKIDWLCLCLTGSAHHLRLSHALFHSPLEVEPKLEKMPTPLDYPYLTLDPALGPAMDVWKVQTKDYPEIDPGLVSTLYGFDDSPDAEVIAEGIASKGPDTVSLGRQANFFLWGFSAPPADMTPAAQRLFVNVVCYMRQFDGQTPLVHEESRSREWALRFAMTPRFLSEDYKQRETRRRRAIFQAHSDWIPAKYAGDAEAYVAELVRQEQTGDKEWMDQAFPQPLREKFGIEADKYIAYYKENLEYLRAGSERPPHFTIDEDAKAVGPSNRSVELLERCVAQLEKHDQPERALRLLARYTQENFTTAGQWRAWLEANRGRLFFSDVGGYKFFVNPTKSSPHDDRKSLSSHHRRAGKP